MLLLGPIAFQDFEVPETLSFGGAQSLAIHRLPGGARVIDAMGRDDAELHWSGTFSGPFASERARTLDLLRADGQPMALTWDAFFYTVVISRFEAQYSRATWIPYRIACTVLADEAAQSDTLAISLAALAVTDAATALGYDPAINDPQAWLSAPGAAISGTHAHAVANYALQTEQSGLAIRIATSEAGLVAPTDGPTLAAVTDIAGSLAGSVAARGYIGRAATNLRHASN